MNILLTNDDGIDSEGILKFAVALRSRVKDRVFILAPDADRSGVSHGLSIMT
jgi:5'-nucleotidase